MNTNTKKMLNLSLTKDPWIPVTIKGRQQDVSLVTLFSEAKHITAINARAAEWVSLMRLFICIYDRSLDKNVQPVEYLSKYEDEFQLFTVHTGKSSKGKRFLQVENLELTGSTEIHKLDLYTACGNTPILLKAGTRQALPTKEQIAISLVTKQCFGEWGTTAKTNWDGHMTAVSAKGGPCVAGTPMHFFIECSNLHETLETNSAIHNRIHMPYELGVPVWEAMPTGPTNNNTDTYFGRLVPLSKAIWIHDQECMTYAEGLEYTNLGSKTPDGKYEPHHCRHTRLIKKVPCEEVYRIQPAQLTWKEIELILQSKLNVGHTISGATIASSLPPDKVSTIVISGLITDGSNWSVLETPIIRMQLPAGITTSSNFVKYQQACQEIKRLAENLKTAAFIYHNELKDSQTKPISYSIKEDFFLAACTIKSIEELMVECITGNTTKWLTKIKNIQRDIYYTKCPANTKKATNAAL